QRPQIGLVGQGVRGEFVLLAVARQERHRPPVDLADRDGRAGGAVRGVDLDVRGVVVEEVIETAAADDGEGGPGKRTHTLILPATPPGRSTGTRPDNTPPILYPRGVLSSRRERP